jgi:hypothetical protein
VQQVVSRVRARRPATLDAGDALPRASTTVQPVGRRESVKWPTSMPATR